MPSFSHVLFLRKQEPPSKLSCDDLTCDEVLTFLLVLDGLTLYFLLQCVFQVVQKSPKHGLNLTIHLLGNLDLKSFIKPTPGTSFHYVRTWNNLECKNNMMHI